MLEIGVNREASLRMWDTFFPNARVFGADVKEYSSSRILKLDQSKTEDLERIASERPWRLVIDDGSHKPSHQLATFLTFFPRMPAGSTYIIEDTEISYWAPCDVENGLRLYHWNLEGDNIDIVGMFRDAVDSALNHHLLCPGSAPYEPVFGTAIDETIGTVSFIRNAIVIYKAPRAGRDGYRPFRRLKWTGQPHCNKGNSTTSFDGYRSTARPRFKQPRLTNAACGGSKQPGAPL